MFREKCVYTLSAKTFNDRNAMLVVLILVSHWAFHFIVGTVVLFRFLWIWRGEPLALHDYCTYTQFLRIDYIFFHIRKFKMRTANRTLVWPDQYVKSSTANGLFIYVVDNSSQKGGSMCCCMWKNEWFCPTEILFGLWK